MIAVAALRPGALLPTLLAHAFTAGGALAVWARCAAGAVMAAAAMLAVTLAVALMLTLGRLAVTLVLAVLTMLAVALGRRRLLRGGGGGDRDGKGRNDVLHDDNS